MFLVIELSRFEIELEAKHIPFAVGHDQVPAEAHRIGDELDNIGSDRDTGVSQREEHIDAGADGA